MIRCVFLLSFLLAYANCQSSNNHRQSNLAIGLGLGLGFGGICLFSVCVFGIICCLGWTQKNRSRRFAPTTTAFQATALAQQGALSPYVVQSSAPVPPPPQNYPPQQPPVPSYPAAENNVYTHPTVQVGFSTSSQVSTEHSSVEVPSTATTSANGGHQQQGDAEKPDPSAQTWDSTTPPPYPGIGEGITAA